MSNTIAVAWTKGNKAVPGTPAKGYNHILFQWNSPVDDSNHDEIVSPIIDFGMKGDIVTFMINTEAVNTGTSADLVVNIYGATNNYSTLSKWEIMHTTTISNADFDGSVYKYVYDIDTRGLAPFMKIGIDPSADLGAKGITVGVITNGTGA